MRGAHERHRHRPPHRPTSGDLRKLPASHGPRLRGPGSSPTPPATRSRCRWKEGLDALLFEDLIARARAAGRTQEAYDRLCTALALWRDTPLIGLPASPRGTGDCMRSPRSGRGSRGAGRDEDGACRTASHEATGDAVPWPQRPQRTPSLASRRKVTVPTSPGRKGHRAVPRPAPSSPYRTPARSPAPGNVGSPTTASNPPRAATPGGGPSSRCRTTDRRSPAAWTRPTQTRIAGLPGTASARARTGDPRPWRDAGRRRVME
ncbi:BTAD domain-containing putative transcriptional regulator [Thermoactinospora rubra]|uniref:BTAD domain-containing putative transcriptional regulator n=1 Tax=Thermoactinospora rubra TaxID=1088767 RepID=UPI001F0A8374|nr:BTAD domain-containing putative transcriptional regulator [Thermoactinospora rubra]